VAATNARVEGVLARIRWEDLPITVGVAEVGCLNITKGLFLAQDRLGAVGKLKGPIPVLDQHLDLPIDVVPDIFITSLRLRMNVWACST